MQTEIVRTVAKNLPKYNKYLVQIFPKEQVDQAADYIGTVFSESVKLLHGVVEYIGYKILTPEERFHYEMTMNKGCPATVSELILVAYMFRYNGVIYYSYIYMPYLKDNFIVIRGTRYMIHKTISERVFTRITGGIAVKVIRAVLKFKRTDAFKLESVLGTMSKVEFIITSLIHMRKRVKKKTQVKSTIMHYLLCKYGFVGTLQKFNIDPADVMFVNDIEQGSEEEFDYFLARKRGLNEGPSGRDVFMKVRRSLLSDTTVTKIIANILYIVSAFNKHTVEHLYEPTGIVYRIMLGMILYGEATEAQAKSHIDTHILSVDHYLDSLTKERLAQYGIMIHDIYDLFRYVILELDELMTNTTHSNLYNKRIAIIDNILAETMIKTINISFYRAERDPKKLIREKVESTIKFPPLLISRLWSVRSIVTSNPSVYNDNWLAACGVSKVRQSSMGKATTTMNSPENRCHPSMAIVESSNSNSKQNPGGGGTINPFLEIDRDGTIIVPPYAADVEELLKYIPYK